MNEQNTDLPVAKKKHRWYLGLIPIIALFAIWLTQPEGKAFLNSFMPNADKQEMKACSDQAIAALPKEHRVGDELDAKYLCMIKVASRIYATNHDDGIEFCIDNNPVLNEKITTRGIMSTFCESDIQKYLKTGSLK